MEQGGDDLGSHLRAENLSLLWKERLEGFKEGNEVSTSSGSSGNMSMTFCQSDPGHDGGAQVWSVVETGSPG